MSDIKISKANLCMEIDECRAMACFLSEAVALILEEYGGFTGKSPVPHGAGSCLDSLADKLQQLSKKI